MFDVGSVYHKLEILCTHFCNGCLTSEGQLEKNDYWKLVYKKVDRYFFSFLYSRKQGNMNLSYKRILIDTKTVIN